MSRERVTVRVKKRIFSGSVCEQEVFFVSDRTKNIEKAQYKPAARTDEEREYHNRMIARRHHERLINENFSPSSLYSTLTFNDENEVHTFEEAIALRDLYRRRLKYAYPEARICLYMGRGKNTNRIHFHMLSDGIPPETIASQWRYGNIIKIESLRAHNYYNGIDHGCDYIGLANYLFDHWTAEQGTKHRYLATRNLRQPQEEKATAAIRNYSPDNPPKAPKGYKLVECVQNRYGYMCFKYTRDIVDEFRPPQRDPKTNSKSRLYCR